ncbi:MAG: cyclopropane-fatty-acyl-phospholipid synthase family protein [Planctomycetaceae bacterium]
MSQFKLSLAEKGLIPDSVLRWGMRRLCQQRLVQERSKNQSGMRRDESLEIAVETTAANEQHYEVPARFYEMVLGMNRKYSCCWWNAETENLDAAEELALARTVANAGVQDGMQILDLGCGWGSLTVWLAERFPNVEVTAISNSNSQREYIDLRLKEKGFRNRVKLITADINAFEPNKQFDRIISVEMMEHVRNHSRLFANLSNWLVSDGEILTHVFAHQDLSYDFDTDGANDWMGRYFFTGGMMPNHSTLSKAASGFKVQKEDVWSGTHYEKTSLAWLKNMDANKSNIMQVFRQCYQKDARLWWNRWRMFFLAVAELFGYAGGQEWGVIQQRFRKNS